MDEAIHIPGYKIERLLGKGAMATVYLAIQESLERAVALKIMAPSLGTDTTFCKRFLKEGRIIGQLNHPNIITIYDTGVFQSRYYMAMEYITGGTLKERIQEGLSLPQALDTLCQIASALGYAHKRGFVHRDVKPANILFRDYGAAVLSDFGIAKSFRDAATQITAVGWTVGTPNYMSPEQALGKTVDARSDLYSLGVVFYEMLTGNRPYQSEDSFAIALMHVQNPVPRLDGKLAVYQELIDRLMAKDPNDRFGSAEALLEAIASLQDGGKKPRAGKKPPRPPATSVKQTSAFTSTKRPRAAWITVGLSMPLLAAAIYHYLPDIQSWLVNDSPTASNSTSTSSSPLNEQTRAQIETLLKVATSHREVGYLVEPPGSNALELYQRVLTLDPQNTEAEAGIEAIADTYETKARQSMEENRPLKSTLALVETGLSAKPDHRGLRILQEKIKKQMATSSS